MFFIFLWFTEAPLYFLSPSQLHKKDYFYLLNGKISNQGSFSGAISRYSRIFFARNRIKIPGVRKKIARWIFLISRR